MELKFVAVKNQKFDFGRTKTPTKCDCEECDFLNCPKKNYVPITKRLVPTVDQFIDCYSDDLKKYRFITRDLMYEFMECFAFPKGTYWNSNYDNTLIQFVTFSRGRGEVLKGTVNTRTGEIWNYDFSVAQERLASRISKGIKKVFDFIKDGGKQ